MMYVIVAILLVVVIIFGVSSTAQSYATAEQARAQIETAKVAQVNAWGNLITILVLALVIIVALAVIAAVIWFMLKRAQTGRSSTNRPTHRTIAPTNELPQLGIRELIELETLYTLRSMRSGSAPILPNPEPEKSETESSDDFFSWLR